MNSKCTLDEISLLCHIDFQCIGLDFQPTSVDNWVYAEPGWARIAALAPCAVSCAQHGDFVCPQAIAS